MAKLFSLNNDTEDKVIYREERIQGNSYALSNTTDPLIFSTTSVAPNLKMCFFCDGVSYRDTLQNETIFTRVGKYYEVENNQIITFFGANGSFEVEFRIEKTSTGEYSLYTILPLGYDVYVSSISFKDSFHDGTSALTTPNMTLDMLKIVTRQPVFAGYKYNGLNVMCTLVNGQFSSTSTTVQIGNMSELNANRIIKVEGFLFSDNGEMLFNTFYYNQSADEYTYFTGAYNGSISNANGLISVTTDTVTASFVPGFELVIYYTIAPPVPT